MAIDKDGVIGVRIITRYRVKAWRQWRDDHRIIGITISIDNVRGATWKITLKQPEKICYNYCLDE